MRRPHRQRGPFREPLLEYRRVGRILTQQTADQFQGRRAIASPVRLGGFKNRRRDRIAVTRGEARKELAPEHRRYQWLEDQVDRDRDFTPVAASQQPFDIFTRGLMNRILEPHLLSAGVGKARYALLEIHAVK